MVRGWEVHRRFSSCSASLVFGSLKGMARWQDGKQGWTLHVAPEAHNSMHLGNHQNGASLPSIAVSAHKSYT